MTNSTEAELLKLKDQALEATKNRDGAFYQQYLNAEAIAVVPAGVFDKAQIVYAMSNGQGFQSKSIADERALVLSPDSAMVTYRATFENADGSTSESFVTTVYQRKEGAWQGVFYQQTPLQTKR